ncbi:alpha-amylase family protein [Pseudonocardia sp. KRD-184]|uniref:Alpha-amylase family protein n=1 Tax=Pseudonocardia oceani TaxID=2792013 RepID=A0ABS6UJF9_9PSEU|nr:alpha-amylase family protein [Pseudonocardia oceani]MBW0091988.1 alpha-amylase family protein [Pseudonocardia oceani]MBW0098764.1 alpha-amylase family protein [Pseudonocardia oceani]MBW0111276.1 alpha-amylase family protein [Pseudonocardia oceani]MBW0124038.1 alpha-amylase family protein [Pseudonocardia oceani]MBW0132387.1 alpha-amylase family protein [Pseudonocardia oceani]
MTATPPARSDAERARDAAAALARLRPGVVDEAARVLEPSDAVGFVARLDLWFADLHAPLAALYTEPDALAERLVHLALRAAAQRPADLRAVDRRREIDPHWFQHQRMVGYVAYTDRFAGTLGELPGRLDHLAELGVTYVHLMPLLRPREGANDGGYAVADYRAVDPRVGTMDDLSALAAALRARDMSLCVDLVLNHTAREHPWAQGWLADDPRYDGFYLAFPDRTLPDAFEETVVDVFPDQAPGSFTHVPGTGWVWTTFFDYQWDLDYGNPAVLTAMTDTILWLANRGVEIFRMDAVPFMGKRLGTPCINQPEVHDIVQAMHAAVKLAAPATVFKAEAIVAPDELVAYLGAHDRYRPECELAYHNQLMVMLWSSLATKDARLAVQSLRRLRPIPGETSWATYVRCHDDIGWAVGDVDARAVGYDPHLHRDFLNAFYAGEFPLSFARGARFGENPATGDARISGSAAALCGISDARERGDAHALELGVRRLVLLHAVAFAWGGVPLLYMGDELAQGNDTAYVDDPALAADNRWMHRPYFDDAAAAHRHDPATVEGRVFGWMRALAQARASQQALHAAGESAVLEVDSPHVLAWWRRHPRSGNFVGMVNMAEHPVTVDAHVLDGLGALETVLSSDGPLLVQDGRLVVPGLGFVWLAEP